MISPRMQALLSKVDAAEAAHFAGLHESAQEEKETARKKKLGVRRRLPWSIDAKNSRKRPPSS
jgi:hypothetical protein